MSINAIGYIGNNFNNQTMHTDQQRVFAINQLLFADYGQPAQSAICRVLENEDIAQALNLFNSIQSPAAKVEAFESAISPGNVSCCDLARQFYDALPVDLQNEFKHQLWEANNRSDNGLGFHFGQHIVANGLTHNELAKRAVQAMRSNLTST